MFNFVLQLSMFLFTKGVFLIFPAFKVVFILFQPQYMLEWNIIRRLGNFFKHLKF